MSYYSEKRRSPLLSSLRDLIIIVIGIMLSFWLAEWRQGQSDEAEEKRIISLLYQDLKNDTTQITQNIKYIKLLRQNYDSILKYRQNPNIANPLTIYSTAYSIVNYVPFNPSRTAYLQFTNLQRSETVKNKAILSNVMELFNDQYSTLTDINASHKDFLINKLMLRYFKVFPHISNITDLGPKQRKQILEVLQDDEILNMMQFDVVLKLNLKKSYESALNQAVKTLQLIEEDFGNEDWLKTDPE